MFRWCGPSTITFISTVTHRITNARLQMAIIRMSRAAMRRIGDDSLELASSALSRCSSRIPKTSTLTASANDTNASINT